MGNRPFFDILHKEFIVIRRLKFLAVSTVLFLLAACGGGGGDPSSSPPTQGVPPPATSTPSPSTSGSGLSAADVRSKIKAAAVSALAAAVALPDAPPMQVTANEVQQFIGLNMIDGQFHHFFGGTHTSGFINPGDVQKLCYNSFETGWEVGKNHSRACASVAVQTNEVGEQYGYVELPQFATCNRARGVWNMILKDGTAVWPDTVTKNKVAFNGLPITYHTDPADPLYGLVDYGQGGHIQPTISAASDGQGGANLTLHFGSNCLGGFGQDDALADLRWTADNMTTFRFRYNCDTCGANGQSGWGAIQVLNTDGTVKRDPSEKVSYDIEYNAVVGEYTLTFKNLSCSMRGNITAEIGRLADPSDPNSVVWDPGVDAKGEVGYGKGWFAIQKDPNELQLWVPTAGVTFDRTNYQIVIDPSICGG